MYTVKSFLIENEEIKEVRELKIFDDLAQSNRYLTEAIKEVVQYVECYQIVNNEVWYDKNTVEVFIVV